MGIQLKYLPLPYIKRKAPMQFTYHHIDYTFFPEGIESEISFDAEFVGIYEEENGKDVYRGDEVEISAIAINGVPVQSFGTSADWRKFLDTLRQAARDQAHAQRVRIELSDIVAGMAVTVVDCMRVAA